jgi:hypothetical protein
MCHSSNNNKFHVRAVRLISHVQVEFCSSSQGSNVPAAAEFLTSKLSSFDATRTKP